MFWELAFGMLLGCAAVLVEARLLEPGAEGGLWRLLVCPTLGAATLVRMGRLGLSGPEAAEVLGLSLVLLVVSLTDLDACVIPNGCLLAAVALRASCLLLRALSGGQAAGVGAGDLVAAALTLALLLASSLLVERVWGGPGVGAGDLKLLLVLALYLGLERSLLLLVLASALGLAAGLLVRLRSGERSFPWGPEIALSAWLLLLWVAPPSLSP